MSWLSKALGAMLLFAPVPFVIPFFLKNYEMRAETTMAFWILGSAIGIFFWIHSTGISDRVLPRLPEISVILLGFIFWKCGKHTSGSIHCYGTQPSNSNGNRWRKFHGRISYGTRHDAHFSRALSAV